MSAVRFNSIFPTERGDTITLEIWDTAYAGSPTAFNTDSNGYNISYSANGFEQAAHFMATQCEFTFWIENSTQEALITDFVTAQEGRFLVRILNGADLEWTGLILFDSTSYQELDYPFAFKIKAVDGIGTLKDIDFKDTGGGYTGKAKIVEYLTRALSKISYVSEFYGAGDAFLVTAVDWWEENMVNSSSGIDLFGQAYLSNAVYYEYKNGVQQYKSCYDVIKDILTAFECRITYANGTFWVEQLSYRRANIIVTRRWETDGSFVGAVNYNDSNPITQVAAGALLSIAEYEFSAPVSEARHEFKALERRNFFAGAENVDETHTGIDTFNVPIHSNNGDTTLRITGGLVLRISSNTFAPGYTNPLYPFVVVLRINLFLDTVGLQRLYTLTPSYQVQYAASTWNATPGCYILQPISGGFLQNTTDDIYTFTQTVDIITPTLPENTESFTFSIGVEAIKKYDGTSLSFADFDITYDLTNLWLEAYSNGGPVLSGDAAQYSTFNTDTQNSFVYKSESLIGSSTNVNTVGAIWVKPSTDYILAELWGAGVATPSFSFVGQLLTTVIASTRAKPTRKLNGSLYGDIVAISRVVWDSENWILMGGTWDAVHNTFSGEWMEMKYATGLTPSAPIKFVAYPDPVPPNTSTDNPNNIGPFRMGAPLGTILFPVASTTTNEDIRPGVITTIDIADTLSDYDFNTGDTINIVNPFTGGFEELTITALTTNGQTSLSVSGTLQNDYPIGSPIVRLPRIGAGFSLPGGPDGAILRRTSGAWKPYGTTALTDGHVLTWTDVGGWAAAVLPASAAPLSGVVGQIAFFNTTTTITTEAGSGVNSLTWDATNNRLGVGTASPATKLTLFNTAAGGSNDGLTVDQQDTTAGTTHSSRFTTEQQGGGIGRTLFYAASPTTGNTQGQFDILTESGGGYLARMGSQVTTSNNSLSVYTLAGAENIRLNSSGSSHLNGGNVGIGTTVPYAKLQINNGDIGAYYANGSDGAALFLGDPNFDNSGFYNKSPGLKAVFNSGTGLASDLGFYYYFGGSRVLGAILSNGKFGIGTSSPAQTLHVTGTARITGSDGTATTLMGRDADGDISAVGLSGLTMVSGTLTNSNTGTLTGNGVANRVPYYNGTTSFANDDGFTFDPTNYYLQLSSQATPTTPTARLDLRYDTTVGSAEWLRVNGNFSGNLTSTIFNTRNAGATGDTIFTLATGGASGGDPILQFLISGVETWSIGVDNSDADKLKIKPQASPGAGATGGEGITMTTAVTPLIGINTDTPAHPLDVNGLARALTWTNNTDSSGATSTFGTGAGGSPTLTTVSYANGNMAQVRFTTGTSPTANATIINIVPPSAVRHANKIYVTFSPLNAATAGEITKFYIDPAGTTPGNIRLTANGSLTAATEYYFNFIIMGHP